MTNIQKRQLPGELFLLAGLILNSLAISLMIKANFGISALDSLPYVLSLAFPVFKNGTWNAIIQSSWLIFTMVAIRKIKPGYLISFVLVFIFGLLLNSWAKVIQPLSNDFIFRLIYFAAGFLILAFGISFLMLCGTPVLPFDTVVRAFTTEKGMSLRKVRTGFDLFNLALSLAISLLFIGGIAGIGLGTLFSALLMGVVIHEITTRMSARLDIKPKIKLLGKLV